MQFVEKLCISSVCLSTYRCCGFVDLGSTFSDYFGSHEFSCTTFFLTSSFVMEFFLKNSIFLWITDYGTVLNCDCWEIVPGTYILSACMSNFLFQIRFGSGAAQIRIRNWFFSVSGSGPKFRGARPDPGPQHWYIPYISLMSWPLT